MATPVSVGELQQAWIAVARGDFRTLPPAEPWPKGSSEQRLLVVGVAGQMGTSTVALALAEDRGAARLVDCAPTSTSGLVGVCDRELGRDANGWWEGTGAACWCNAPRCTPLRPRTPALSRLRSRPA